ncbi:hypothetical protein GCM10007939_12160 [Amylibacter marinus]|uniref:DUF1800 domain-containing protein n=1 Tax=Amylibacter marinus TaxID=1475483 RepID=A0ABQ5VV17_9RHOB|nr:DUF1800 domain-containing protein [Amylibacter marinus]GLQ34933.1 hypothetical protein GCM10007939_12160 [Amylibacter marinus]
MAHSPETISAFRYGFGLGQHQPTATPENLIAQLHAADTITQAYPTFGFDAAVAQFSEFARLTKAEKSGDAQAGQQRQQARKDMRKIQEDALRHVFFRAMYSPNQFRERLVHFWLNHFTVSAKNARLSLLVIPFVEEAIRPHIASNFTTLLTQATLHPAMLDYLDQSASIGPNSIAGRRRDRGLNENLARELLELHTLGVNGAYTQTDVRQLAELLTGLRTGRQGMIYQRQWAEPGTEQILGKTYGGDRPQLAHIHEFLDDLARRADTATHITRKLAVHFFSDNPPQDLLAHMASTYRVSGGDLMQVYGAMLTNKHSFSAIGAKVRTPFEYVVSGLRALGITSTEAENYSSRHFRRDITLPMRLMGQVMFRPAGPDGWPEDASAWITPSNLAGRLQWAMQITRATGRSQSLDPRLFLTQALGDLASKQTRFAASNAANRQEALALILASPEFNRR